MNVRTHEVQVTRDGRWWVIAVPEIDQLTQARRLADVEQNVREMIAVWLDVPVDSFAVNVTIGDVGTVRAVSERATLIRAERLAADELARAASARATELAHELATAGVPVRDIGAVLGVSFQRAQQLVSAS